MNGLTTVILAAGEGKRMRSRQPKVLHELCGRPLISYSLRVARAVGDQIVLIVGPDADGVRAAAGDGVTIVEQRERLGTGHAVLQARAHCEDSAGPILVLPTLLEEKAPSALEWWERQENIRHRGTCGVTANMSASA